MPSPLLHLHRWISSVISNKPHKMIVYFATYRPVFHPTTTVGSLSMCTGLGLSCSFRCSIQLTQYRNKSLSFQHCRFSKYLLIEQWDSELLVSSLQNSLIRPVPKLDRLSCLFIAKSINHGLAGWHEGTMQYLDLSKVTFARHEFIFRPRNCHGMKWRSAGKNKRMATDFLEIHKNGNIIMWQNVIFFLSAVPTWLNRCPYQQRAMLFSTCCTWCCRLSGTAFWRLGLLLLCTDMQFLWLWDFSRPLEFSDVAGRIYIVFYEMSKKGKIK